MLFDIRKIEVRSVREFAREYVMIVVGILTALGLEHAVTNREHAKSAAESRERIVAELRSNLADLSDSRAENLRQLKPLVTLFTDLKSAVKAGESREQLADKIYEQAGHLQFAFSVPSFRHEAWDVAVANQSATYINADALRRYSAAYATERDILNVNGSMGSNLLQGSRFYDVLLDVSMRRTDPTEFLKAISQAIATLNATIGSMGQVEKELEAALAAEPSPVSEASKKS